MTRLDEPTILVFSNCHIIPIFHPHNPNQNFIKKVLLFDWKTQEIIEIKRSQCDSRPKRNFFLFESIKGLKSNRNQRVHFRHQYNKILILPTLKDLFYLMSFYASQLCLCYCLTFLVV